MKTHPTTLTQDRVKQLLSYNPESGEFRRILPRGAHKAGAVAGGHNKCRERTYWSIAIDGKSYFGHRLAWLYMTGQWPSRCIDHIDGDGLNNAWRNLREATISQNQANSRMYATNTSGRKGVTWHRGCAKWQAAVKCDGRNIHLGLFDDLDEAHAAYVAASKRLYGEFARAA